MRDIPKGMLAGLVATIVLSVLMVLNAMMGLMPQLDIAKMIAGTMGSPDMGVGARSRGRRARPYADFGSRLDHRTTYGVGPCGVEHAIENRGADDGFGTPGSVAAAAQSRADQRLVGGPFVFGAKSDGTPSQQRRGCCSVRC